MAAVLNGDESVSKRVSETLITTGLTEEDKRENKSQRTSPGPPCILCALCGYKGGFCGDTSRIIPLFNFDTPLSI
jgi:hypothetical protein